MPSRRAKGLLLNFTYYIPAQKYVNTDGAPPNLTLSNKKAGIIADAGTLKLLLLFPVYENMAATMRTMHRVFATAGTFARTTNQELLLARRTFCQCGRILNMNAPL